MQPSTACLWRKIKYPDKSTGQYGFRIVLPWIYVNDKKQLYRHSGFELLSSAESRYGSKNAYITTKWHALPPMTNRWKISWLPKFLCLLLKIGSFSA